jgi:RNA polymerase sigma factor (sigma-70 family)
MGVARRSRAAVERAGSAEDAAARIALLLRWRAGDAAAGDLLLSAFLSMVDAAASRWSRRGVRRDDLVQEGRLAVVEALRRYDDAVATAPLSDYVGKWVDSSLKQHVMSFSGPVRPTTDEDRRGFFVSADRRPVAVDLDETIRSDEAGPEELAIENIMTAERREIVERCLELLSARERDLIRRRALAEAPEKLADIAAERGITRQSVHGLEASAMEKMRTTLIGMFGMRLEWLL